MFFASTFYKLTAALFETKVAIFCARISSVSLVKTNKYGDAFYDAFYIVDAATAAATTMDE